MATTHSLLNGQPYPGYILQFSAGTTADPGKYFFRLAVQPASPTAQYGEYELPSDQLSVLESVLEGMAAWLATQSNVQVATGSPDLLRIDEAVTTLYSQT